MTTMNTATIKISATGITSDGNVGCLFPATPVCVAGVHGDGSRGIATHAMVRRWLDAAILAGWTSIRLTVTRHTRDLGSRRRYVRFAVAA